MGNQSLGRTSDHKRAHTDLDELEKENASLTSTKRLEHVLDTLDDADELNEPLCWNSELWEGCTVEELLGGLIEAEQLLEE